jgi:translin
MNHSLLESSLSLASKKLDAVSARREKLIKESRDIISLSSKAIVCVHTLDTDSARKLCTQARKQLVALRKVAGADLTKYILVPEQEYVECSTILSVTEKKLIPSMQDLGVSTESYVLGLLDTVGELKRSVYDKIRQDNLNEAESLFETMEELYVSISPFAVYDNIIRGLRRKLDVSRVLIEDTREAITEEVRRKEFILAMNEAASTVSNTMSAAGSAKS